MRKGYSKGYKHAGSLAPMSDRVAAAIDKRNLQEARLIAVGKEAQATVTLDCMARRLREADEPLWLLCAARAAMQRAGGIIGQIALPDGELAGKLTDALEILRDWRKAD